MSVALIDADVIGYRIGWACKNESATEAYRSLDRFVADVLLYVDHDDRFYDEWKMYLTGKDNFRKDIAVSYPYKGTRPSEKPPLFNNIRQRLVDEWGAVVYDGIEADDAIATDATALGDDCCIVSVDKDFNQVQGWHYNFVKRHHYYVDAESAKRFLYQQILTGDKVDNIVGLKNIGEVKALKILSEAVSERELYDACVAAYDGNEARVIENARLLFLRRYEGQSWNPPEHDK